MSPNDTSQAAVKHQKANANAIWKELRLPHYQPKLNFIQNVNDIHNDQLSLMDRIAVRITDKVGSMGFFTIIFIWTILWCSYNILASEVPSLHWKSFDPFPAFVAYLLISNVIQICLMPLIMVGQNLQSRHSELRAEMDYKINNLAEKEVTLMMSHLERQTNLLILLMEHQGLEIPEEMRREIVSENQLAKQLIEIDQAIIATDR